MQKQPDVGITHYKSGRDSWKVGYSHYWLRVRGFITTALFVIFTMGIPWWWQPQWSNFKIPRTVTMATTEIAMISIVVCLILFAMIFFYARKRAQRSISCKDKWHSISHKMRDSFCSLLSRTGARKSMHDLAHERRHLVESANDITQSIVDYYQMLTHSHCIGAAIRLAVDPPKDGVNQIFYTTVGRAGSLNHSRINSSEPIAATEGLPKLFRSKEISGSGVIYIHDMQLAIRHGLYKDTDNEKSFSTDYDFVVAVPLNGWNGRKIDLIGILTITGRSRRVLAVQHVDLLKAIGDRLAEHYSATVARLSASNRMPSFSLQSESIQDN